MKSKRSAFLVSKLQYLDCKVFLKLNFCSFENDIWRDDKEDCLESGVIYIS